MSTRGVERLYAEANELSWTGAAKEAALLLGAAAMGFVGMFGVLPDNSSRGTATVVEAPPAPTQDSPTVVNFNGNEVLVSP